MAFDKELFKVKARVASDEDYTTPTDKVVCGFYYRLADVDFVDVENEGYAERLEYPNEDYCIACDTLCRNTGIKVKGRYVYEYDLVMYGSSTTNEKMGMIVWDEMQHQYGIRPSSVYNQFSPVKNCINEIIGNFRLSDKDAAVFQEYSEKEAKKYNGFEPVVECRSKQQLNRIDKAVFRNMGLIT